MQVPLGNMWRVDGVGRRRRAAGDGIGQTPTRGEARLKCHNSRSPLLVPSAFIPCFVILSDPM